MLGEAKGVWDLGTVIARVWGRSLLPEAVSIDAFCVIVKSVFVKTKM